MNHLRRITLAALLVAAAGGCRYVEQRWNDWTDVSTASLSLGGEIGVKFGELAHLGLGGSVSVPISPAFPIPVPFLYQLMYGPMPTDTELWWPVSTWLAGDHDVMMALHTIDYRAIYPREPVPDRAVREINPNLSKYVGEPPEHRCYMFGPFAFHQDPVPTMLKDYFTLELAFVPVIGGKVRFNIVELADFFAGFIPGVDFLGDDHLVDRVRLGPYWYKHIRPEDYAPIQPRDPIDVESESPAGR
jgi:hypothetical protein